MRRVFNPKMFLFAALFWVSAATAQPAPATAPVADDIQIEVRASKTEFAGGEPVVLTVILRNNTAKPVSFLMRPPGFEFEVRNNRTGRGRGLKVRATAQGRDENSDGAISERVVAAKGQSQYRVVLSRLFDLSRSGIYTVAGKKSLKLAAFTAGGNLIGETEVARIVKIEVLDDDVSPAT